MIVCEGFTEENYFKSFPVITAKVESIPLGCDPLNIVQCCLDLIKKGSYDHVWCVFDVDIKPSDNTQKAKFNNAISLAENNDINIAYSNDCLELWFYLHFQYTDQKNLRDFYFSELGRIFNINYRKIGKNRSFTRLIYSKLQKLESSNQDKAIERAKKLVHINNDLPPFDKNPYTTVHLLVESLNKHLKE